MFMFRLFSWRSIATLALAATFSSAAYGFAAGNTLQESGAGDGAATISGYTTSNITYVLNSTNPANLDSVSFKLTATAGAPAPITVKAKLVSSSSTWFACTAAADTWTCPLTGVTAQAANELRVVAAQ
jgi:hypothetical protein